MVECEIQRTHAIEELKFRLNASYIEPCLELSARVETRIPNFDVKNVFPGVKILVVADRLLKLDRSHILLIKLDSSAAEESSRWMVLRYRLLKVPVLP